jgi:hypothetical protein
MHFQFSVMPDTQMRILAKIADGGMKSTPPAAARLGHSRLPRAGAARDRKRRQHPSG